jgi:hypothetical protein
MTPIDLRIKYKFDTGLIPTYGKDTDNCYNYRGGLTNDYAEWLENEVTIKRIVYKGNTGLNATFRNKKNGLLKYTTGYKEWLERKHCLVLTVIEKLHDPKTIVPYIFDNESYK